ncbi:MAG: 7-alpha-hydroxysteroid dehydrogenase [Candidatus Binatota bacterium]|nr:7-alpha-hydroxysteroid dehydrogenase [Candidatus Binatota bacterium]
MTGVESAFGRAIAGALARAGADLYLVAEEPRALDAVAPEIAALGRPAIAVPANVARADDCHRLAEVVSAAAGRVDVLALVLTGSETPHAVVTSLLPLMRAASPPGAVVIVAGSTEAADTALRSFPVIAGARVNAIVSPANGPVERTAAVAVHLAGDRSGAAARQIVDLRAAH